MKKLYGLLGSYGLSVTLILLLFVLTFLGTIEQADAGLYEVQKKYFESLFLVHWLGGVVPIPLPGAYLVLVVLGINLLVGGIINMRKNRDTVGILVVHAGILLLFAAAFVKLELSADGHLTLYENQQSDEFQSYREWELAIYDAVPGANVPELLIPDVAFASLEGARSRTFTSPELPFKLTLSGYVKNGAPMPNGPVDGFSLVAATPAKEQEQNLPGLYVRAEDESGAREGIVWGGERYPLVVHSHGKAWAIDLRHRRFGMPFTIVLDRFKRELHPRTGMAKVFSSEITKVENGVSEKRRIEMNEPLRQGGLVLFQASWGPPDAKLGEPLYSTFAVVRNPSDQWPLAACVLITLGMAVAFSQKLLKHLRARSPRIPTVT